MKKPRFKIGEWVRAENTVKFDYNGQDERIPIKQDGINGVVVGATTRFVGRGNGYGKLYIEKALLVWQIRQGYSNKPYEALDEDVVSLENFDDGIMLLKSDIPFRYNNEWHGVGAFERRQNLSNDSKCFDRDKMGRFV